MTHDTAPVLAILLTGSAAGEAALSALRKAHPGAHLVVLTRMDAISRLSPLADEVWGEGVPRGPVRFLALMRRMSWMGFAHVHDLEGTLITRFMRFCVWPRPVWHAMRG
jgi:hypothetical protein